MYKDKDKQREANRKAQAKFKVKGITNRPLSGITLPKETDLGNTLTTTQTVGAVIPKRGKDIKCFADLPPDVQDRINRLRTGDGIKARETGNELAYQRFITGKLGDADYNGVCTEAWRAERGR